MSGHLDAYDVATGGVDDGSGVTPTMEAARLIMEAGGKPKRTILAILWAGEEFGLLGSKSWIERNINKLDKISNMVNRDGGPTVPTGIRVPDAMRDDFEKICESLNDITFQTGDPKGYNFSYGEIWHTERDLYNKSIPEYQEHAAIATAIVVYGIADLDHLLSRDGYYIEKIDEPVKKKKNKK
ncbi:hypothetical protein ES705_38031 [subsurface metagenome]